MQTKISKQKTTKATVFCTHKEWLGFGTFCTLRISSQKKKKLINRFKIVLLASMPQFTILLKWQLKISKDLKKQFKGDLMTIKK